jgi:hypothetical protein
MTHQACPITALISLGSGFTEPKLIKEGVLALVESIPDNSSSCSGKAHGDGCVVLGFPLALRQFLNTYLDPKLELSLAIEDYPHFDDEFKVDHSAVTVCTSRSLRRPRFEA